MLFDWLADANGSSEDHNIQSLLNQFEKLILFVGLLGAPCCVVFVTNDYDGLGLLWLCMSRFQIVTVCGIFLASFCRIDKSMVPWWMSMLFTTLLTIAVNLSSWESLNEHPYMEGPITSTTMVLKIIALLVFIVSTGQWLYRLFPEYIKIRLHSRSHSSGSKKTDNNTPVDLNAKVAASVHDHDTNENGFFPGVYYYYALGTVGPIGVLLMFIIMGPADQFTSLFLAVHNAAFIMIELGLLFHYLRLTKYINAHNLMILVESRKQYLRYIAHEIRLVNDFIVVFL